MGYDLDRSTMKLVINEKEAVIVRLIFKRFLEGYSYREIMEECNHKGYKTKRGSDFTPNSLNSILSNEKYIGVYIYNKSASRDVDGKRNGHKYKDPDDIIRIEDAVPPLIDKEDFEIVRKKMANRKQNRRHSRAKETYLLKGTMFCGICGGAYVGTSRHRGAKGQYWIAYGCNIHHRHKDACSNKEISKPFIEGVVLEKLSEYVFHEKYIPRIAKEYNRFLKGRNSDYQSELKGYQQQLNELERNINSLVDMLMKTQSQVLLDKLNALEEEKVKLESKLDGMQNSSEILAVTNDQVRDAFGKIREKLKTGDLRNTKQVIDTYISKILVYPKSVEIRFNFFPSITLELEEGGDAEGSKKDCHKRQSFLNNHQYSDGNGGEGPGYSSSSNSKVLCFEVLRAPLYKVSFVYATAIIAKLPL